MALNKPVQQNNGLLNVSALKYYNDTLRPACEKAMIECKTDPEIERSLRKIENSLDSMLVRNQYKEALDVTLPFFKVITTDKYYVDGSIKKASETEKEQVKGLVKIFNDFRLILKVDEENKPEAPADKIRDRVGYVASNDASKGYNSDTEHNMENLMKGTKQKRIPNTEYVY